MHLDFRLSSSAPLWGLTEDRESRRPVKAIMPYENIKDLGALKASLHTRISIGIAFMREQHSLHARSNVKIFT